MTRVHTLCYKSYYVGSQILVFEIKTKTKEIIKIGPCVTRTKLLPLLRIQNIVIPLLILPYNDICVIIHPLLKLTNYTQSMTRLVE